MKTTIKRYLVGGAVRDKFMNQPIADYDYTTPCTKDQIIEWANSNNLEHFVINDKYNTVVVNEDGVSSTDIHFTTTGVSSNQLKS